MGKKKTKLSVEWLGNLGNKKLLKKALNREAVIVYSGKLDKIIWANASGAGLFGGTSLVNFLSSSVHSDHPFLRQLEAAMRQLGKEPIYRGFRVVDNGRSRFLQCEIGFINLKGTKNYKKGKKAILITCANPAMEDLRKPEFAQMILASLSDLNPARAICDEYGLVVAATDQFADIRISPDAMEKACASLGDDRQVSLRITNELDDKIRVKLNLLGTKPKRILMLAKKQSVKLKQTKMPVPVDVTDIEETSVESLPIAATLAHEENTSGNAELPDNVADNAKETPISVRIDPISNEIRETDENHDIDESTRNEELNTGNEENTSRLPLDNDLITPDANDGDVEISNDIVSQPDDGEESIIEAEASDDNEGFAFSSQPEPVRFAWITDTEQVFTFVSEELAEAVGPNAADIVGRKWVDVATVFGFDNSGEIHSLLKKQDTWSGKTVLWPVQGTDLQVPVDLAALPSFSSGRNFDGFRGFGIVRMLDTIVDPEETGLALTGTNNSDIATIDVEEKIEKINVSEKLDRDETGKNAAAENSTENKTQRDKPEQTNIVDLSVHRGNGNDDSKRNATDDPELTNGENRAFREIGKKLRGTSKFGIAHLHRDQIADTSKEPDAVHSDTDTEASTGKNSDENDFSPASIKRGDQDAGHQTERIDTSLLSRLPVPVLVFRSGETLFANQELLSLTGYADFQELQSAGGIDILFNGDDSEEIADENEIILNDKDGGQMRVRALLQSVPWDKDAAMLLSFRQPRHEKLPPNEKIVLDMMRVSELHNILDTATDGIIILTKDGIVQSINHSAEALFGRADKDVSEKSVNLLFASESHTRINEYLSNLDEPQAQSLLNDGCEVIGIEANGGMIPLYVTIGKIGASDKYCAILRDMTPWKKAREDLVEAKRQAETASNQKTDFLARVSHEIRTPLNAIIGFSDVMIEERFGPIDNERYREYLRDINRSGVHVLDLINDLLDISKIEAGKMELSFEAVDLNQIVGETVALLQPQANGNRVLIRTSLSRAVPRVVADARSIRQIVLNLVSNAIKFTNANGQVIVSTVYEGNGEVALRVRDTGRGMSDEEVVVALKPFRQVNAISETRGHGTGLGLPLTKALVEANKAYFDIESEPGEGTIVMIQFPTQRVLAD